MSKSDKSETNAWVDPMKAWRDWFIQSEREWSEAMTQMMKNDSVARAVGQEINAGLYRQQMMTQGMAGWLGAMNLPTRDDITALSERLGRLEDSVARVEAGLTQWRASQSAQQAPQQSARPPRTRKPAAVAKPEHATKPERRAKSDRAQKQASPQKGRR